MSPTNRFRMPLPEEPARFAPLGRPVDLPIEPFPKLVEVRDLHCAGCGKICRYESSSSGLAGSPEFLRAHPDTWLSFVVDPRTETLEVLAACSEACVQRVLRE
mgnify:CR=1 FL=1